MAFTTPSYSLTDLFTRAERGELQLPDFQRGYIWDVDRTRALISTVLRGYPVGAFLALDTRGVEPRFRPRPLPGAPSTDAEPGLLLLDGHHRLASLYRAFRGDGLVDVLDFRGGRIKRHFYVDVAAAVSTDPMPEEAVFAVDTDGIVRSHFGPEIEGGLFDREAMIRHRVVPVNSLLGDKGSDLLFDMAAACSDAQLREQIKEFHNRIVRPLAGYTIPVTRLDRRTSQIGVGQVFAQANSAGVKMDVFELLTASFALEDPQFILLDHWEAIAKELYARPALAKIDRIDFLRAVSLLVSSSNGPARGHRGDILNLKLGDYLWAADRMRDAFIQAAEFLEERCIFTVEQVPYTAQLVPLAVILARLTDAGVLTGDDTTAIDRVNCWFWSGVFGELYGAHAPSIRAGTDVDQVTDWAVGQTEDVPKTIQDAECTTESLFSADEDSGIYRGLFALLMARGALDWRTGKAFDAATVDELEPGFYPVFPPQFCHANGVDDRLAHSVLNRTPLGRRTEAVMEGGDPKRYLSRLQSKAIMEDEEFDSLLSTHELVPEYLFSSNWQAFFDDRLTRFRGMIEYAMDKPVR
ncbi:DUF262 domain-containing protein [Corynebacterium aquatimens]|uniref:GmrSD restriction endonucleases N-terminal domain-containing protein n=1 Tax=Corynebacterium aquatimens TaxID=1190508 RepID=A0A931E141_9CORY|nr:DUF262 domain-containing protein [Corynebacterium aquatimens]MBG6121436.1 hypothetical protein [Corynebacterium aquatimens]WJY66020.1 hypothetical protein CAQUA_06595 [Corynebacterium aquatimens]